MEIRVKKRILLRFLLSYMFFLLVPIIASSFIYMRTFRVIDDGIKRVNESIMTHAVDTIDRRMAEIDSIVTTIAQSNAIQDFLRVPTPLDFYAYREMRRVWLSIPNYPLINDFIHDLYIYFHNSGIIMSDSFCHIRLPFFYRGNLQFADMAFHEWKELFFGGFRNRTLLAATSIQGVGTDQPLFSYLQTIPNEYARTNRGTILVLIKKEQFERLLSQLTATDGSWLHVLDRNQNLVLSLSGYGARAPGREEVELIDGDLSNGNHKFFANELEYHVSSLTSEYTGWKFIVGIPTKHLLSAVTAVKRLVFIITLSTLIAGCFLAYFLASYSSKPFQLMLKRLLKRSRDEGSSTYAGLGYLQSKIAQLIDSSDQMQVSLQRQQPFVRSAFLERLIRGEVVAEDDLQSSASLANVKINAKRYLCVILQIEGFFGLMTKEVLDELNMARLVVKDSLDLRKGLEVDYCDVDINKIAILARFSTPEEGKCLLLTEQYCERLEKTLAGSFNFPILFFGGSVVHELIDLSQSYNEAKYTSDSYVTRETGRVTWYSEIQKNRKQYHYPIESEMLLLNSVKSGSRKKSTDILNEIFCENLTMRELDPASLRNFCYEISGTFRRMHNQIPETEDSTKGNIDELIGELENMKGREEFINLATQLVERISASFDERKKSHNKNLLNEIKSFIDAHYVSPTLSLHEIASHFGLSEVYLSQFFKEQSGENFIYYLTSIRMNHASKLLTAGRCSIGQIAEMTGYFSTDTFRKAFKRQIGFSPTAFRENHQKTKDTN
jgi:two-component system, response regulator YesN